MSFSITIKLYINGFGHIGRLVFRAGINNPNIEFVDINDLVPPENIAYLLKYDSTHSPFRGTMSATSAGIIVNDTFILCTAIRDPKALP